MPAHPQLRPDEPAAPAIAEMLLQVLDSLEATLPAVRKGRDLEALHAFRVAVRRTRVIGGQFKAVLPDQIASFMKKFDWLGSITGPVRDLDIYLVRLDAYEQAFPSVAPTAWLPLREAISRERRLAHRTLVHHLNTARYTTLVISWRAFLNTPPAGGSDSLLEPVVSARLWKLYRHLLAVGREALASTDNQKRHQVRITAKKLRYVLDAFEGLYPSALVQRLLRRLEGLQDILGDHHDLTVLRERLPAFGELVIAHHEDAVPTLLAMGRLDLLLERNQDRANQAFSERFIRLDDAGLRKRVKRAFVKP